MERVSKSSPLSGESLERVLNLGEDLRDSAQSDLVVATFCIPQYNMHTCTGSNTLLLTTK